MIEKRIPVSIAMEGRRVYRLLSPVPSMGSRRPQTPLERADDWFARKLAAASARGDFGLHDP
jgi:hypothetical protein